MFNSLKWDKTENIGVNFECYFMKKNGGVMEVLLILLKSGKSEILHCFSTLNAILWKESGVTEVLLILLENRTSDILPKIWN